MRGALLVLVGSLVVACASDLEPVAQPACSPIQFRACLTSSGQQGREQCVEPGQWTACIPSVYDDASYPDVGVGADAAGDADADAAEDAGEDGEAGAELDAADAGDSSLLD